MTPGTQQMSRWLWVPILLAYLAALVLPAVKGIGFLHDPFVASGYDMLLSLPFALLVPSWWANPIWMFGMIALVRHKLKWAWWCGLVGTILALLVLVIGPFPPDQFHFSDFRPGYYVWLGSMLALLLTAHGQTTTQVRLGYLERYTKSVFILIGILVGLCVIDRILCLLGVGFYIYFYVERIALIVLGLVTVILCFEKALSNPK